MNVFYRMSRAARDARFILIPLAHDVEVTVSGEEGRDVTFKALAGDHLVLVEDEDGSWAPMDLHPRYLDLEDSFIPDA